MNNLQNPIPSNELPDWMRRAQRGVDWGFLLVLILCLIVSAPFILRSELPHNNTSENWVYRTSDYADSIQEGWLYPRWSPHVLGGYGAPIPSFYPPAPAYLAAVLQILLTNNAVSGVRLLYVLAICVAGTTLYALVMRQSGALAGVLAAMIYIYSPYPSLVAPHILGDLPAMLILALTPALLWSTDRLIRGHQPYNMLLIVVFTAGLILTSPKGAVAAVVLATVYAVWAADRLKNMRTITLFPIAIILGVLLASFYWIPAVLEQAEIHWQANRIAEPLVLKLSDLVSAMKLIDPAEMVHHPQLTLGIVTIVFAMVGILVAIIMRKFEIGSLFFVSGICVAVLGLTVLQHETWLLGLMVMCFAVAGSDVLRLRSRLSPRLQRLMLPILLVGIWIGSTSVWSPPLTVEAFGETSGTEQVNYEQQGYGIAVLPAGDAIPSTLPNTLASSHYLIDNYKTGSINKLAPGQISGTFQASPLAHFVHGDRFQVRQVSSPITLTFLTAYFAGWHASIGDQRLNLQPNPETGLIQVEVPALKNSNAELSVTLDSTPLRFQSWIVASIALAIAILGTIRQFRTQGKSFIEDLDLLKQDEARLIALPVCCFGLVALLILIPNPLLNITPQENSGLRNSFATQIRSNTGLSLGAFRLNNNVYSANDTFDITLYWQAQRFLAENYQVRLFLENSSDGSIWNSTALQYPGFYPPRRWNTRQYVSDPYSFQIDDQITAGNYQIHVEAYRCADTCENGSQLDFFNTNGEPLGTDVTLPTLISIRP